MIAIATTLVFAAVPAQAAVPPPSLFGINPEPSPADPYISKRDLQTVRAAGAKWVRLFIDWAGIEPRRGKLDFSRLDRQVGRLSGGGLGIDALLMGTPQYACGSEDARPPFCPPKLGPYKTFLKTVVTRYKRSIKYWEVWSEPNDGAFWKPRPDPGAYAKILKFAYKTIKRTDSKARVLMAATGPIPDDSGDEIEPGATYTPYMPYTARLLKALRGAKPFDIVALHPYRGPRGPYETRSIVLEDDVRANVTLKEELLLYRGLFRSSGFGDSSLWLEIGWGSAPDDQPGEGLVTHTQQAQFLEEFYRQVRDDPELAFVQSVFWWNLRDLATGTQGALDNYGLVRRDYSPKPAFEAYRRLAAGQ